MSTRNIRKMNNDAYSLVTLHVPSRELDTKSEFEVPDAVSRLVIEDTCSDE